MFRFHRPWALVSVLLLFQFTGAAQYYTINTIAGLRSNFSDGSTPPNARFGIVSAVATGPDGSVYVADAAYHQVFRVGPDGHIKLFAGSQTRGFGGDFGPATSAMLDTPTALAVDSGGDVFIGDSGNHRVREVTVYGNIQTVAGNGQVAPSPALSPVLPGEGGPATAAPLNQIAGLAIASNGDLVISDIGNNRIFCVSHEGNIHTIAGNAISPASLSDQQALGATLNAPTGVAADLYGNVFFAEQKSGVVRQIDTKGNMTRIVGTGSPTDTPVTGGWPLSYPLFSPMALASDGWHLYIADNGRISMYTLPIGRAPSIQTVAGNSTLNSGWTGDGGPALAAGMNPTSVAVNPTNGAIYLADSLLTLDFRNRVRMIQGNLVTSFAGGNLPTGQGDNGPATSAQLYFPRALALDSAGNIDVADTFDNRVRTITTDGKITTLAGTGNPGSSGDNGPATSANVNSPQGLALDGMGNLYISDATTIRQVNAGGVINTVAALGSPVPVVRSSSLAVDAHNNLFAAALARVREISASTGVVSTVVGMGTPGYSGDNGSALSAQISDMADIAVDADGNLYIADGDNNRVRKVNSQGNITTFAGGGTSLADGAKATDAALDVPIAVALDAAGNVFIAEFGGNRVRMVTADGTIQTIAGNGLAGFNGDGGLATNASLNGPTDVQVDTQGNVYIADSVNSIIRKLTPGSAAPTPVITTVINSASLAGGPVAPGERVMLTGSGLGPNSKVFFGNVAAPVLSSTFSSAQVVVPYELSGQSTAQVTVNTGNAASAPFAVQVAASAPGIFTVSWTGEGQAVAFNDSGTANSPDNPAVAGSVVSILCTGEGLISPSVATGVTISSNPPSPVLPITAMIDGIPTVVDQAYSIPGTIGQFVVDLVVPDNITDSTASFMIMVGNAMTQLNATVAVKEGEDSDSNVQAQTSLLNWYWVGRTHLPLPRKIQK